MTNTNTKATNATTGLSAKDKKRLAELQKQLGTTTSTGKTLEERRHEHAEREAARKGRAVDVEMARLDAAREFHKLCKQAGVTRLTPDRANYGVYQTASGKTGIDNGDLVAALLRPTECPEDVYAVAAQFFSAADVEAMRTKYAGKNNGMVRMNVGNRLRGLFKRSAEMAELAAKLIAA